MSTLAVEGRATTFVVDWARVNRPSRAPRRALVSSCGPGAGRSLDAADKPLGRVSLSAMRRAFVRRSGGEAHRQSRGAGACARQDRFRPVVRRPTRDRPDSPPHELPDTAAQSARMAELARQERELRTQIAAATNLSDSEDTEDSARVLELRQALRHVRAAETWTEEHFVENWATWEKCRGVSKQASR